MAFLNQSSQVHKRDASDQKAASTSWPDCRTVKLHGKGRAPAVNTSWLPFSAPSEIVNCNQRRRALVISPSNRTGCQHAQNQLKSVAVHRPATGAGERISPAPTHRQRSPPSQWPATSGLPGGIEPLCRRYPATGSSTHLRRMLLRHPRWRTRWMKPEALVCWATTLAEFDVDRFSSSIVRWWYRPIYQGVCQRRWNVHIICLDFDGLGSG